jgi:hypothetical protein
MQTAALAIEAEPVVKKDAHSAREFTFSMLLVLQNHRAFSAGCCYVVRSSSAPTSRRASK